MYEELDRIHIDGLHLYAYHGVHDFEKENGQNFYINATLYLDTYSAGTSDALEKTVSYSDVSKLFAKVFCENKFNLIETAAHTLAEAVLFEYETVRRIDVEICKPEAPIGLEFESVSVDITRMWHRSFLAIGSNIGERKDYIDKAIELLSDRRDIRIKKISDIIETEPYGVIDQDKFLNGALEIETLLSPYDLLDVIHEIEAKCERQRVMHWGPRTLDLDILFYDRVIMDSGTLTIPHPDMVNRDFVLIPMNQIAPGYIHPVKSRSISELLNHLETASCAATNTLG